MMRFYAPFITEATPQVTMALRSERAMVRLRQKILISAGVNEVASTTFVVP